MNPATVALLGLFVCIAYVIKTIVEGRVRSKLIAISDSDLVTTILIGEEQRRRMDALQWGTVLSVLAAGFGVVQAIGWHEVTAGAVGILVGSTGLGNIIFYSIARKVKGDSG